MKQRRISLPCVSCSSVDRSQFLYGVPSLTQQLRQSRFGSLPPEKRALPERLYDSDGDFEVDPTSDTSMDRFERTEAAASLISDRMRKSHEDKLKHAEA